MAPRTPPMIGMMSVPSERAPKTGEAGNKKNSMSQFHKKYIIWHFKLNAKLCQKPLHRYVCHLFDSLISRALRVFTLACAKQRGIRGKVRARARGRGTRKAGCFLSLSHDLPSPRILPSNCSLPPLSNPPLCHLALSLHTTRDAEVLPQTMRTSINIAQWIRNVPH